MKIPRHLPFELVDIIADYHDYNKYCKPPHRKLLKNVLTDIKDMASIMTRIQPRIAWECWGNKPSWEYDWNPEDEESIYDNDNELQF